MLEMEPHQNFASGYSHKHVGSVKKPGARDLRLGTSKGERCLMEAKEISPYTWERKLMGVIILPT